MFSQALSQWLSWKFRGQERDVFANVYDFGDYSEVVQSRHIFPGSMQDVKKEVGHLKFVFIMPLACKFPR